MAGPRIDSIAEKNLGDNEPLLKTEIEDDDIRIEYKHPPELNGQEIAINVPTQPKTIVTTEDDFNLDGFIFKSDIKTEGATLQIPDIGRRNLAPITYDASAVTTRLKEYERRPLRSGGSNIINDVHLKKFEIRLEKLSDPIRRTVPLSNVQKSTGSENSSHLSSTKGGVKSPKKLVRRVYPVKKLMVRVDQLSDEVLNKHLTNVIAKSTTRQKDDLEKSFQIRERCLSLKHEIKTPTNTHNFECYICHYVGASTESQLKQHMQKHTFAFACSICHETFLRKRLLTMHQQRHTALRQFECKICLRKFKRKADLKSHLNIHLDYKPFECSVCSRKFKFERTLRDHQRLHSGEKPFSCPHCPKKFSQKTSLRYHLLTHTGERKYSCDYCSMTFLVLRHLKIHRVTHTGEKLFQCTVIGCLKKFARMSTLVQHRRTHTGERPYACDREDCSKSFSAKYGLRKHERTHTKEKPFQCSDCSKKFAEQYWLKVHRRTHTGERPYSCGDCPMKFITGAQLNRHTRRHTGEKPFKCTKCSGTFARGDSLRSHMQRIHMINSSNHKTKSMSQKPNPKIYECYICRFRGAATKQELENHIRIHSQDPID